MPTVRLGDETVDGLRQLAAGEGMPYAEFVRTVLEARVHGLDHAVSVAAARIRRVAGDGVETDHAKLQ